jgi:hypothetical protein
MATIDRRTFGAALIAGGSVAGHANEVPAADEAAAAASPLSEVSEVGLLVELALRDVPKEHRTPEVMAEIRLDIERNLGLGRTIARFPLANGDAPASPFRAWRAD